MKGIILAGGTGSRLAPLTHAISKQLLPIYDKPMIYYPLSVLMLANIREILIITTKESLPLFQKLLGDGSQLGIRLFYEVQNKPQGIAEAILIGESFINEENFALILGDNLFYGQGLTSLLKSCIDFSGAVIFGYHVKNANQYGVVCVDANQKAIKIIEKPKTFVSDIAVTGLYFFDKNAIDFAKYLTPSHRNELEISDINQRYLEEGQLSVKMLGRGIAWLDTGTYDSLLQAGQFIQTIEVRQGFKIACLEEIAFQNHWIDKAQLRELANSYNNDYQTYLENLI